MGKNFDRGNDERIPFLTRKITIGENRFEKFNVPKGKKRIWFKAAKEMRNEIKDKRSSLEILFSQNKIKY